jgi:DNA-binding response OmpR family regulator
MSVTAVTEGTAARTPIRRRAQRRSHPPPTAGWPVEIRPGTRTVVRGGTPVRLSRLEYDLLLFFVRHPDRVFTRHQLLTHVWGHTFAGSRTVDVHIRRLRMKL